MSSIKDKIEKLLRLSLSGNSNEAKLAAEKAFELMQRYAIEYTSFSKTKTITKRFEIKYLRVPIWLRELYNGLSYVNGCYMAWSNGYRDKKTKKIIKRAEIFLTGRECDVLNTEYLLHIFIREIDRMGEEYKKTLPKNENKRKKVQSYKLGLGEGLCDRLLYAADILEANAGGKELALIGDYHSKYIESMEKFIDDNNVSYVVNDIKKNDDFQKGIEDAQDVDIHKPLDTHKELFLPKDAKKDDLN